MTLRSEGTLDGRRYSILRNAAEEPRKFKCLECMAETKPAVEEFTRHDCAAAAKRAPRPTSTESA